MPSVYALGDPRTDQIRYIGSAKDVYKRYAQHLNNPHVNDIKNTWIDDLKKANISPTLTILESDISETAIFEREKYWIQYYFAQGAPLTNIACVRPRRAILQATMEMLSQEGYHTMTIEAIAARAGVGKKTIYRWWPSKAAVVLEALTTYTEAHVPFSDTGSLEGDLQVYFEHSFPDLQEKLGTALHGLAAEAQLNPEFAHEFQRMFIVPRRETLIALLQRGVQRGEIAPDTNLDVLVDLIYGAKWYRPLLHPAPLDEAFTREIVELIMRLSK